MSGDSEKTLNLGHSSRKKSTDGELHGIEVDPSVLDRVVDLFPPAYGVVGVAQERGKTTWGASFGWFSKPRIRAALMGALPGRGRRVLALRFTNVSRFGAIDIDSGSIFHNRNTSDRLFLAASNLGLKATLCQSSESGGWHYYVWFKEFHPARFIYELLRDISVAAGITTFEKGTCELYPDYSHPAQAFRLPCQTGFEFLRPGKYSMATKQSQEADRFRIGELWDWVSRASNSADGLPRRIEDGDRTVPSKPRGRPPRFIAPPSVGEVLPEDARLHIQPSLVYRYNRNAAKTGKPPFESVGQRRFDEGRKLFAGGLDRSGQRNAALLAVGFFLFFVGYVRATDRERLMWLWLSNRHNGFSKDWLVEGERERMAREIRRLAAWRPGTALIKSNETRRRDSETRIAAAASALAAERVKITTRRLAERSGLSLSTVGVVWPVVRTRLQDNSQEQRDSSLLNQGLRRE